MGIEFILKKSFDEANEAIEKTAKERMEASCIAVKNKTAEVLSGGRWGRLYYVPGTHKKYQASAPGEAPAVRTGMLRKSVAWQTENEGEGIVGLVGSDQKYAPMLEFGTSNMKPRPWLRVAFEKTGIKAIFERKWLD